MKTVLSLLLLLVVLATGTSIAEAAATRQHTEMGVDFIDADGDGQCDNGGRNDCGRFRYGDGSNHFRRGNDRGCGRGNR